MRESVVRGQPAETAEPVPIGSALPSSSWACEDPILVPGSPRSPFGARRSDPDAALFGTSPVPQDVRVQWPGDPSSVAGFVWRTDADTYATRVRITNTYGDTEELSGGSFQFSNVATDGRVHEVHACGLTPGMAYTWQVGGGEFWSEARVHTTAPLPGVPVPFVFGVAGDTRGGWSTWTAVLDAMAGHGVAFRVLTGDAVVTGTSAGDWSAWLAAGRGYDDVVPTVMAHGNHEDLAFPYFALNAMPGNELTFSFDYSNAHFVVLNDTPLEPSEWEAQSLWLAADLAATSQPWKFVFHHKPAYTASRHPEDMDVRTWFVPVEEEGGVAIDFAGHNHNYERTFPLRSGVVVPSTEGTTYIVTAGAGAPLYENFGNRDYAEAGVSVNHYVIVRMSGARLDLTAYDLAGNVLDTFTTTR